MCAACLAKPQPFAPEIFCRCCHAAFHTPWPLDEDGTCLACRTGVNEFDAVYCYGAYDGDLTRLIHLFKYDLIESLAQPLGRLLARAFPREGVFDALVPVPIHWRRRWRRGFNQAEELARVLRERTGVPIEPLLRRRTNSAQAGLNHRRRRANVRNAFTVPEPGRAAGRRLLLIDDVFTTGATANACARALKQAGAAHVSILALARADRRQLNEVLEERYE